MSHKGRPAARQDDELLADWQANTDIDQDQAVKDYSSMVRMTRGWAIGLPILGSNNIPLTVHSRCLDYRSRSPA